MPEGTNQKKAQVLPAQLNATARHAGELPPLRVKKRHNSEGKGVMRKEDLGGFLLCY